MSSSNEVDLQGTLLHTRRVAQLMSLAVQSLLQRAVSHDESKLHPPEAELFAAHTQSLKYLTYGSPTYEAARRELAPALTHHYANNPHHPEHYPEGIEGMSLIDLLEMLLDWRAATERHDNGDIRHSIEINQARYGYNDALKKIFLNTLEQLDLLPKE